jgi:ABC-type uncharacterized transport system YnjBCD permease subunit
MADLVSINVSSGVNERGEGFCSVSAVDSDGRILLGQLDPATMRVQAMQWLEAAEAAEHEAALLRVIRNLELPDQLAAAVIVELRNGRSE